MSLHSVTAHDIGMGMKIVGGQVFITQNPEDVYPDVAVRCDKHPKVWTRILVPNDFNVVVMQERAQAAVNRCAECREEQKLDWKTTRWPEGAEI